MKIPIPSLCLLFVLAVWNPSSAQEQGTIPLSVRESLLSVLENNFEIIIGKSDPLISEEKVKVAESAFDPKIFSKAETEVSKSPNTYTVDSNKETNSGENSVSVGLNQTLKFGTSYELSLNLSQTTSDSPSAAIDPAYIPSLNLTLSHPLLKGSGSEINTTQIAIAKNTREISDHEFSSKVMEVLTRTQKTYWSLVALNKELKVLEESLERAKDFRERIELQVKVGVLAPIEITAAKAVIAVREEALIEVRHGINNTQDELKALLNRPDAQPGSPVTFETTDEPVYKKVELRLDRLKEMAFENRRDYRQASLAIDSKHKELQFNRNQLKWSLNLTGGATLYGTRGTGKTITDTYTGTTGISRFDGSAADAATDMGSGRYYEFSVGLIAEYPLYNRKAKSNVAKNVMELSQAETKFMSLRQGIELEVLSATRAVKTAEQKIHASRASRVLAEKKLEAETKKYDVGASTIFTVLEYQNDLAAEQSKEINAVTDYITALAQLDLATGMVLKKHNVSIE